jgi:hypothetical protein
MDSDDVLGGENNFSPEKTNKNFKSEASQKDDFVIPPMDSHSSVLY